MGVGPGGIGALGKPHEALELFLSPLGTAREEMALTVGKETFLYNITKFNKARKVLKPGLILLFFWINGSHRGQDSIMKASKIHPINPLSVSCH
jgi:hypothetical protein